VLKSIVNSQLHTDYLEAAETATKSFLFFFSTYSWRKNWFIIMIIIISYSYLITTTTYYLSKHPTCKTMTARSFSRDQKVIWFIIPLLCREERKTKFFSEFLIFLPLLAILDIYGSLFKLIPSFGTKFSKKKFAKKIYKCVRNSWFWRKKSSILQQQQKKHLSLKKELKKPNFSIDTI